MVHWLFRRRTRESNYRFGGRAGYPRLFDGQRLDVNRREASLFFWPGCAREPRRELLLAQRLRPLLTMSVDRHSDRIELISRVLARMLGSPIRFTTVI